MLGHHVTSLMSGQLFGWVEGRSNPKDTRKRTLEKWSGEVVSYHWSLEKKVQNWQQVAKLNNWFIRIADKLPIKQKMVILARLDLLSWLETEQMAPKNWTTYRVSMVGQDNPSKYRHLYGIFILLRSLVTFDLNFLKLAQANNSSHAFSPDKPHLSLAAFHSVFGSIPCPYLFSKWPMRWKI